MSARKLRIARVSTCRPESDISSFLGRRLIESVLNVCNLMPRMEFEKVALRWMIRTELHIYGRFAVFSKLHLAIRVYFWKADVCRFNFYI
jgi:hypothetical protein